MPGPGTYCPVILDCVPPEGLSSSCVTPNPAGSNKNSCVSNPAPPTVDAENAAGLSMRMQNVSTSVGDEIDPLIADSEPLPVVVWPGSNSGASPCSVQPVGGAGGAPI